MDHDHGFMMGSFVTPDEVNDPKAFMERRLREEREQRGPAVRPVDFVKNPRVDHFRGIRMVFVWVLALACSVGFWLAYLIPQIDALVWGVTR